MRASGHAIIIDIPFLLWPRMPVPTVRRNERAPKTGKKIDETKPSVAHLGNNDPERLDAFEVEA